jgi:type IV secretion system protein TrbI
MTPSTEPVTIQNKFQKPPGLLPKNVQSWLLAGLATLMVSIMWLTSAKKPAATVKGGTSAATLQAPLEVNETKIAEMQNRIQDLQRQQLLAQSALAQQSRPLSLSVHDSDSPQATATDEAHVKEDSIEAERKRRDYLSLFASNVALSYRKSNPQMLSSDSPFVVKPPIPPRTDLFELPQVPKEPGSLSTEGLRNDFGESIRDRKEETKSPSIEPGTSGHTALGKTYVLFEGTILETVLINRLDGGFTGPVECLLSTDVYSNDRQHLLIPAGSKLLGETRKVDTFGQTRLAVMFHRLLMPDGYSVSLDGFKGLNQTGDTGLRDQVNNHYLRIFGVSLAIGALGAVAEGGTAGALTANGTDLMRQGFAQNTVQSSAQILDRFLNIMPTVTIREGHRVKVYLAGDLTLPDYPNHKIPSDL